MLDRLEELEKAALLARIFGAYVEGRIDQSQMRRLASILERALLVDLLALRNYVRDQKTLTPENFYGLESVGLASTYHSIVRPVLPGELQGQLGDLHFILNITASLVIEIAF